MGYENEKVHGICKLVQKGEIRFDNAVQRGLVWDVERKSLLIHSMLSGYPILPFYATREASYGNVWGGGGISKI